MKIRFYRKIDGWRWIGFIVAMIGTFILSSANVETQWMGWALGLISCSIWVYFGFKDGDMKLVAQAIQTYCKLHGVLRIEHLRIANGQ